MKIRIERVVDERGCVNLKFFVDSIHVGDTIEKAVEAVFENKIRVDYGWRDRLRITYGTFEKTFICVYPITHHTNMQTIKRAFKERITRIKTWLDSINTNESIEFNVNV